jgi:hypothetical protein
MELRSKLKKLAVELDEDFFGVASLSSAKDMIEKLWEKEAARFPRAISFGIALPHDVVNQQPNRFSSNVALNSEKLTSDFPVLPPSFEFSLQNHL